MALEPLTILVGRNASGKSNFLDALAFLSDLMEMAAPEAANRRRGWAAILCRTGPAACIEMEIASTFASFRGNWDAEYAFSLKQESQNHLRVDVERLVLHEAGSERAVGFDRRGDAARWIGREHLGTDPFWGEQLPAPHTFLPIRPDRLLLSALGTKPFVDLADHLRASRVYNFAPPRMRDHQPRMMGPALAEDGSNLARAIEGLREIEPETVDRLAKYLAAIAPSVVGFRAQEYGDYETVRFQIRGDNGRPVEFDASGMSDGTLRVLGALLAAYQIVLPVGYPGFVGIEEPETALHPAAMRALVAALDEATLRTQVLLTTHSPDLLDAPEVKAENVRVVESRDGATAITPLDEVSVGLIRDGLATLGDLERDRQLELDRADLERQRKVAP